MKLGGLDISTVKLGANQVQAVYQGVDLVWQNAPVATAATGVGQTSFTANWNAYTGAVVYLLDVSVSSDFSTFVYEDQQVNAPTTSYVVIGLNPNTTYYYRVRASTESLTDADYQAVLDYATTQGYTLPSSGQQALQNQLVVDLKDAGIWSKLGTFVMMANDSADYRFAFIDWKRLVDYSPISSIDSTYVQNRGFYGDGIGMGIDTNFNLSTNTSVYNQNDAHKMIWKYEDSVNYPKNVNAMDGVVGRSGYNSSKMTNSNQHRLNSSTNYSGSNTQGGDYGFYSLSRNTSSTFNSYTRDSTDISMVVENATSASISLVNDDASIFLGQTSFGVGQFMATAYSLGLYLTATEIDDYYTALNTYISTL